MKQLLTLAFSFCLIMFSGTSFSQITPTKGWEKFYGDDHDDNEMKSIIKDGDFIVVAGNYVNDDSENILVAKYKTDGTQIWSNVFGIPNRSIIPYVIQKGKNGNYFVFADGFSAMGRMIHEVNHVTGDAVQTKFLENSTTDYSDFKALPQGGFMLIGERTDGKNLFKLDDNLNEVWSKKVTLTVGGTITPQLFHMDIGADHIFLLARGVKILGTLSGDDIVVAKLDLNGNLLWNKTYGSKETGTEELTTNASNNPKTTILAHPDGGAVFTARLRGKCEFQTDNKINVLTIKCDKDGNQQWWHVIGQNRSMNVGNISIKPNGNIILCGKGALSGELFQNSVDKSGTATVYELDKLNGKELWIKEFGGANDDKASCLVAASNSMLVVGGRYNKGFSDGRDKAWIFSVNLSGISSTKEESIASNKVHCYPNPTNGHVYLKNVSKTYLEIINSQGVVIKSMSLKDSDQSIIDISDLDSGIYSFKFDNGTCEKIVKL